MKCDIIGNELRGNVDQRLFARHRDVRLFGAPGSGQSLDIFVKIRFGTVAPAAEFTQDAAVEPLKGVVHLLTIDHAAIILAQDHIDRVAEPTDLPHHHEADGADQEQKDRKARQEFFLDIH